MAKSELTLKHILGVQVALLLLALAGMSVTGIETKTEGAWWIQVLLGIAAGCLLYGLLLVASKTRLPGVGSLREGARSARTFVADFGYGQIVLVSAAAAIGEEYFCRIFLQSWAGEIASPAVGIVVGAIVFALMHAISLAYALVTLVVGLVIGTAYAWSGSALLILSWHFSYDLLALFVLIRRPEWIGLAPRSPVA